MNSEVEEIFAFKTCCGARAFDQNLEIHVKNIAHRPVVVPSHCDLHGTWGTRRIANLMPSGPQEILPGEIKAFYCMMDASLWNDSEELVFYDIDANAYVVALRKDETGAPHEMAHVPLNQKSGSGISSR